VCGGSRHVVKEERKREERMDGRAKEESYLISSLSASARLIYYVCSIFQSGRPSFALLPLSLPSPCAPVTR
jgi:hypothetical protein